MVADLQNAEEYKKLLFGENGQSIFRKKVIKVID